MGAIPCLQLHVWRRQPRSSAVAACSAVQSHPWGWLLLQVTSSWRNWQSLWPISSGLWLHRGVFPVSCPTRVQRKDLHPRRPSIANMLQPADTESISIVQSVSYRSLSTKCPMLSLLQGAVRLSRGSGRGRASVCPRTIVRRIPGLAGIPSALCWQPRNFVLVPCAVHHRSTMPPTGMWL